MFSRVHLLALALLIRPACVQAQTTLQVELGLWNMTSEGTLSVGADDNAGTEVDVAEDLDLDREENIWQAGATIGSTHQLALSYLAFDAKGHSMLPRTIEFGGFTYDAKSTVTSRLQGDLLGVGYRYAGGDETWRSGFLAGVQLASLETEVADSEIGNGQGDISAIVPTIGVFAEWHPTVFLQLSASLHGGSWDWQETSVTFYDAEASARVLLFPFFAGLGYRHLAIQGDDTSLPIEVDLTFSGPTWYAGLTF